MFDVHAINNTYVQYIYKDLVYLVLQLTYPSRSYNFGQKKENPSVLVAYPPQWNGKKIKDFGKAFWKKNI